MQSLCGLSVSSGWGSEEAGNAVVLYSLQPTGNISFTSRDKKQTNLGCLGIVAQACISSPRKLNTCGFLKSASIGYLVISRPARGPVSKTKMDSV